MKSVVSYLHWNYSSHLGGKENKDSAALGMHRSSSNTPGSGTIERVYIMSRKYRRTTLSHEEDVRYVPYNIIDKQ